MTVENRMVITLASASPKRFWEAALIAPGKMQGRHAKHVLCFTNKWHANQSGLSFFAHPLFKKKKDAGSKASKKIGDQEIIA